MKQDLTLREAVAENRLDDFVRQEENRGKELANGSELERALALLVTKQRLAERGTKKGRQPWSRLRLRPAPGTARTYPET